MKNDHVNVYKGTLDLSSFDVQGVIRLFDQIFCFVQQHILACSIRWGTGKINFPQQHRFECRMR